MNNTTGITIPDQKRLSDLSRSIKAAHATVLEMFEHINKKAAEMSAEAISCGSQLNAAKEIVKHGDWEAWVDFNCGMSVRTAQDYMKYSAASKCGKIPNGYSYTAGLKFLSTSKAQCAAPSSVVSEPLTTPETPVEPFKSKGEPPQNIMRLRSEITRDAAMRDLTMRSQMLKADVEGLVAGGVVSVEDLELANVIPATEKRDVTIDCDTVPATALPCACDSDAPERHDIASDESESILGNPEDEMREINRLADSCKDQPWFEKFARSVIAQFYRSGCKCPVCGKA